MKLKFSNLTLPALCRTAGTCVRSTGGVLTICLSMSANVWAIDGEPQNQSPITVKNDGYEDWNAKLQSTYIWQKHPTFNAAYSGVNSMAPISEKGYTWTGTAFLGWRAWNGGEIYFNPEAAQGKALSHLHGLGALTNGENQKDGGANLLLYRARLFLRQTWGMGGGTEKVESAPNTLAGVVDKNRLVLTAGNVALTDIFDNNAYSHDPRTQFQNWTIMINGAFDYAADARGYTWGVALEYYWDEWAFRTGRFEQPIESNGLALDSQIMHHYGDQIELEHSHELAGCPGKLRILAFHNKARMGGFQDALNFWRANGGLPDVANVRKERDKYGYGVNLEQAITDGLGLFARAGWNDGESETYAFTEAEKSVSAGVVAKGFAWRHPNDTVGLGFVQNGLSAAHQAYLAAGGLGAFIGDGNIRYKPEIVLEAYYNANIAKNIWLAFDYQHAANPAYNASRGPIDFYGIRLHLEY